MQIFVGDRVRTPDGEGFVEEVETWRDRLLSLGEMEAREFAAQSRMECGPQFQEQWGRVRVRVGRVTRVYPKTKIQVLEGRDEIVRT